MFFIDSAPLINKIYILLIGRHLRDLIHRFHGTAYAFKQPQQNKKEHKKGDRKIFEFCDLPFCALF